jgi:hypothetical protein
VNKLNSVAIAVAIGLAFSAGAIAQTLSNDQHRLARDRVDADYQAARAACESFAGNARDVCRLKATGKESVAKAELEAARKPSNEASYKLLLARAEADYSVANEKCDDMAGNVKAVCQKEAKAREVADRADAKAQLKISNANDKALQASARANDKADEKAADARKDAASDKRDAEYAVAKEKCYAFAGEAKSSCMSRAKARFGKS